MKRTVLASLVTAVALATGTLAGCAAKPDQADQGPAAGGPPSRLPAPVLAKNDCTDFKASVPGGGSDPAPPAGSLPADAHPVSLLECVTTNRDVPDQGQWLVLDTLRSTASVDPFISTLRAAYVKPPERKPKGSFACPAIGYLEPWVVAVDADGKAYRIAIPKWGACPAPDKDVTKALADLKTTVVSTERIRQLQSPGAQASGCAQQFADMAFAEAAQVGEPGAPKPFFEPGGTPAKVRVCYYRLAGPGDKAKPAGDFEAAATLSEARTVAVYDSLTKAPVATAKTCDAPASEYAVLTPEQNGSWSVVELDGCRLATPGSGPDREVPASVIEVLSAAKNATPEKE